MTNEELIKEALKVVNPKKIGNSEMGQVGCALLTDKGNIFKGVCIDTSSGLGFCAEHTAISQMITHSEYEIKKIVAVYKDEKGDVFVLSPCGRCREFMLQTNKKNLDTDIILDKTK
ncbi:MAG: cytidine deaminase, partial [Spirochaetes bacterium]|nr:cytidine deaminase [Spirochaetota bacterium]